MRYSYRCPVCGTSSRPYFTWLAADSHGHRHRARWHDGDYPDGEEITSDDAEDSFGSLPRGQQLAVVVIVVALLLAGACQALTR